MAMLDIVVTLECNNSNPISKIIQVANFTDRVEVDLSNLITNKIILDIKDTKVNTSNQLGRDSITREVLEIILFLYMTMKITTSLNSLEVNNRRDIIKVHQVIEGNNK